jgi:hypothetical protein
MPSRAEVLAVTISPMPNPVTERLRNFVSVAFMAASPHQFSASSAQLPPGAEMVPVSWKLNVP